MRCDVYVCYGLKYILKRRKACGKDGILNEMLVFANEKLIKIFQIIFNHILDEEKYPEVWNYSLTQLIFKEGDKEDPGNYRGNTGGLPGVLPGSPVQESLRILQYSFRI